MLSVLENFRGMADSDIIRRAVVEQRTIVTLDKDFAFLVFSNNMKSAGIVLLRLSDESQENIIRVFAHVIELRGKDFLNSFIVAKNFEVRVRNLP